MPDGKKSGIVQEVIEATSNRELTWAMISDLMLRAAENLRRF